jgi:hypothetical protein
MGRNLKEGFKMKIPTVLYLLFLSLLFPVWPNQTLALGAAGSATRSTPSTGDRPPTTASENTFNLSDFGAIGDGVTDAGPALQNALDVIGETGGGTLLVPAGRYVIITPVQKDFTGLASDVSILGVESFTPVPPPTAIGAELSAGLNLVSEFAPATGEQGISLNVSGLQTFLIKDITFIGTPGVNTDALITLELNNIREATIRHCEFYGLASIVEGGAIVQAARSNLKIEQTVFLGSTSNSGVNTSVVQSVNWKGLTIADSIFIDYGQRPELYGKLSLASPFSWAGVGNAAAPETDSPRREVVIRNVFTDEGALNGLLSRPQLDPPPSARLDLFYITGLFANVSNLNSSGNYLFGLDNVLIEKSHYGWSHAASAAINLRNVNTAIIDRAECLEAADRISADSETGNLTVIDSIYNHLDSDAHTTRVLTTNSIDEDPVQYVRQQFTATLGRDPDAAAHFYWANRLLQCGEAADCIADQRVALNAYLDTTPSPDFSIAGQVTDESGAGFTGVVVTLGGSQSVTTQTDPTGRFVFSGLPTSGVYTVTPDRSNYTFSAPEQTITTPDGDQSVNFEAVLNRHDITVQIVDANGHALPDVTVSLSGMEDQSGTTNLSGVHVLGDVPAGGDYTITPAKQNYTFSPESVDLAELQADQTITFTGTLASYTISGRLTANGEALPLATVNLSGSQSSSTTTDEDGRYSFNVLATGTYTVAPLKQSYLFSPPNMIFDDLGANQVANFSATLQTELAFSAATYSATEGAGTVSLTVNRTGDESTAAEVIYSGIDGSAQQRSDVVPIIGRLRFAPGETTKSIVIFITDDARVEGNENLTVELSDLVNSVSGGNRAATLTIVDNDISEASPNPIDSAQFFVNQQYNDFLNRAPDAEGLTFWSNQITSCGTDAGCIADRRTNVSAAFFLSIEFQQTGFLVYRLNEAAFAQPPKHLKEFLLDTRTIGDGVIVNAPDWQSLLESNKTAFIESFVARPQFIEAYPLALTPAEFVNQLNSTAGSPLSADEINAAVAEFAGATTSEAVAARARVLRRVAENQSFSQRQLNPAFVLMQYFGYLQRNPSDAPDTNLDGYNFWLGKLNEFGGDFRRADMVKSFLVSAEYRSRFGLP